ncbi:MAG: DJ-1/PfpI family protein [Kordiimonas sp.]
MKIAILLYPNFTALDAIGPYEILAHIPGNEVMFVAKDKGLITADSGVLTIEAKHSMDDVQTCDMLLIPGGEGEFSARKETKTIEWIKQMHETSRFTTSVCTGSMLLAKAGILNGLNATSHWAAEKWLPEYGATYQADRWVEEGKIITAAGVSAGIDMALHIAAKVYGEDVAKMVQLMTEYDPQPPFDSGSVAKADPRAVAMLSKRFEDARATA